MELVKPFGSPSKISEKLHFKIACLSEVHSTWIALTTSGDVSTFGGLRLFVGMDTGIFLKLRWIGVSKVRDRCSSSLGRLMASEDM